MAWGDAHVGHGDQLVGQPDIQLAAQMLMQTVDLGSKAFQRAQQLQCRLINLFTLIGHRKSRSSTLANTQAQTLLQIAHLLTDCRTTDAERTFRGREATSLDYAFKQAQESDIKVADLCQRIGATGAHCLVSTKLKIVKVRFSRLWLHGTLTEITACSSTHEVRFNEYARVVRSFCRQSAEA